MAELDATQMPEEIIPSEELATTEETPEEVVVTDQEPAKKSSFKIQVPKPQAPKPTQPKRVTEEEKKKILEIAKPKTITSTSTETGLLQTSAEAMSTGVEKPPVAELKSKAPDIVSNETPEEKSKREYFDKKLEYQLSSGKKPEFKINAKYELEKFLGGDPSKINWEAYDQSKKAEINKAIRDEMEKDIDPMYDPTGTLQFISSMTPNALKSGLSSVYSGLVALGGAAIEFHEKASKQRVAGAAFGETAEERKATLPKPGEELSTDFYKHALKFQERSEKYMIAAELNSGIKEKNVGKGAFELLTSNEPGDTWDGLTKLGLSVTQQIPQLVALATTGGSTAGVFAGAAALGTGTALTEEYKKDRDISAIDAWKSIAKGAIEGATENLFKADINALRSLGGAAIKLDMSGAKKTMKDFLAERGRKALEDQINRTYLKAIGTTIKNSLGEGGEEILAAIGSFIVDRIEDGKWVQEEYDKLQKQVQEGFLIGATTGFSASVPAIRGSVTPLTTEQKRRIVNFRQIANDETADKSVREIAQKHADDIIKYNADLSMRKYAVIASLPIAKRKIALDIESKIRGLEDSKKKVKDVDVEAQIDKDVKKLQEKWSNVVVSHAIETAQADAKAKAERKANAPKVMTSTSTEVSTAAETMQVDTSMMQGDFDILKGLTTEEKQTLINIQNAIQSIDPDARVMLYANQDELKKGLLLSGLSAEESSKRSSYSEAVLTANSKGGDPIIHVNLSSPSNSIESAAHEAAHIALMQLAKDNPEAFVAMRDTVLRMMKNSQSKPLIDFANQYGRDKDGNLIEDAKNNQERAEEFLVQMVGTLTAGKGKIERTVLDQIARALRDFLLQASRAMGSRSLEAMINKAFENTTSGEQLAKYFEGLAAQLKVGGKIDVSYLSDAIPLTPAQEQRLQGLAPGSEQYHEAAQLNATENSPSNARPTMEADASLVENPNDTVARSQMTKMTESEQHKKYLRVVKGMEPGDIWLSRALAMDESRGGKLFAIGNKDKILEEMQKEMDQIEADANHSNKYYLTELKPGYIAAQIAKYEKDPRFTDNLTEWKMIRDDANMRERYIKEKAAEQKGSLTGNIAYLKGNDTYSIPFQYAMIKDGISSRYTVEAAEEGEERKIQRDSIKPSQLNTTEKPIITMQPGIVASAYADYGDLNTEPGRGYLVAQINMPKIEVAQSEFAPFIFKQSDTGEGYWLKFNQSSNIEDAKPLHKIASTSHKYPAQWCTGGALDTAKMHLSGGDFYVFVDNKTGDARVAVRYTGKNQISEVRGLGDGQAVLPNDNGIIDELVNTFPGGEEYKKDAKVQNTLKEILDSLPDEASRKRFTLNESDFKQWIVEGNYGKLTELPKESPRFDNEIKEKIIEIDEAIEDIVIKRLTDGSNSKQDIFDLISIKDKSYREQNHALTRTKRVVNQNIDEVFKPFGYGKGEVVKSLTIKGDDNPNEYKDIRLVIGYLNVSNTGNNISFPKLENVTGEIELKDSWSANLEDVKGTIKINFPLLASVDKLKINMPFGNNEINFDSLNEVNNLETYEDEDSSHTTLNFPKLEKFGTVEGINIGENASLNVPLLKEINNKSSRSNNVGIYIYGKFNAPNLKFIDGDLNIDSGAKVNLDKLEELTILSVNGNTIKLPSLKNVNLVNARSNANIYLNNISFERPGWKKGVDASHNSQIFINKITTAQNNAKSVEIEASEQSKIVINEIEREGGFSQIGGVRKYKAYYGSKIDVLKGADNSWADVWATQMSNVNISDAKKISELTIIDSAFDNNSITDISILTARSGSLKLPNVEYIRNLEIEGETKFEAEKLSLCSELEITNFREGLGLSKISMPNLNTILNLKVTGGHLTLPDLKNVANSIKITTYSNLKLPKLRSAANLFVLSNHSSASIPLAEKLSSSDEGSIFQIGVASELNAPNLNYLRSDSYIEGDSKLFAPKLGYNGTSSPDATVAKSQMSKDIKKLEEAIHTVRMAPGVKFWMEPTFESESSGIPKTGNPSTIVFSKQKSSDGVSDFVAYYSENGNLVSTLNILTEPNKEAMSSKGAFKITTDPAEKRKGYATVLLNAAQDNGLDIIGNLKSNRFSNSGKDLVEKWIKSKMDAMIEAKSQLMNSDEKAKEISDALAKASGTTQVATTTGSYEKAAKILKGLGVKGDILDYGAGLGLGTDAMSNVLGTKVKSLEINTERWKGKDKVTYTDSKNIDQRFDGIVSLNVVNVVPKDVRDEIVKNIFDNLNIGGTAIISSRKFKGDIDQAKNFELGAEDKSYIIKRKENGKITDVYQKGFDGDELVEYVKGLLGDAADVKKNNTFGAAGVVITKNSEIVAKSQMRLAPNGKPSNLTASQYETVRTPEFKAWFGDWENDPENASKFVDENGEPQVFYHGTEAEFDRFSTDPKFKRFNAHNRGIFFTATLRGAKQYGDIQMPVFLNAKTLDYNVADVNSPYPVERQKENDLINNTDKEGVVLKTMDKESVTEGDKDGLVKQYVVFDPNQILTAGDKTYVKSQLAAPMYAGTVEEDKYLPGTTSAKKAEDEGIGFSEALTAAYKEAAERNTNVADLIKNAGMMQSFYNLYNKAGATPFATIMFRDAYADVYGEMDGKKLSAKDKGFLDDIILLRRTIAIDENFDNRNEARPLHTSFDDYETKKEVPLSKEEALKQLEFLKTNVYNTRRDKLAELERRANNYFKAFSDILKYKYENGVITKDEYDMYKDYNYQPRKFLKFIKGDTPQSAFNTRGVQITRNEIKKIESGDTGYMMTDSEKLLKMGFISAVNKVFSNRAKQAMFEELNGRNLGWAKPANYDTYADGTVKLNKDGSPKLMDPDAGYRNMTFKVEGKVNAFQLKENLAKEYEDEEMWDTRNWLYRASTKAMGAWLTSAMAVGVNASFVIANISTDLASQLFANNLYSSKFGVLGQGGKALSGTLANSLRIAKLKTGLGDNSRILNAINEYGKMGGMQQTLANETGAATKVGEALSILADISELAARITAFENKRNDLIKDYIKKNGSDPVGKEYEKILMQASYEARAAMDYHRGGRTTKFLNPLFAFLNVTTQGAKITASYIKNNYKAFSSKIFQAGGAMMALTFYNMMMAGDDWENEDLKRAKRDKIIIFSPFKNADGTHSYNKYQIPTPIKFFFNVFQSIAENIFYKAYAPAMGIKVPPVDKTANKEMADNLKSFVPPAASQMPSTAKFFYEYSNNYSLWNQRALSQDALKDIIPSQEGEENPEILSFYKVLFRKASEITDGAIEISPERFQKASEDSFLTSPENQFLLAGFYTILDQMTNAMVGGVDPKIRSKYLANGDFSDALSASFGTFKNRLIGTTDKTKNEKIRDLKEDAEYIHRLQRIENSKNQDISNTIKTIFKKYKDAGVEYTDAKEEVMHYYKSLESKRDKEYAKNYIEKMIGSAKVEYKENIPVYLMIQNVAKDSDTKAKAIYTLFTLKGKDPMKDKVLGKDLFTIGFRGSVMDAYKKLVAKEEAKKAEQAPTVEGVDPETGLPPGFDPTKY